MRHAPPRIRTVLLAALLLGLLPGCSPQQAQAPAATPRPAVDALDRETADARKARVSAVEYDLYVDLHGGDDRFGGELTARFTLADAASDLSIDFGGGRLHGVRLNGSAVAADYNGFFLTLPAAALKAGANTVSIRYEHPYATDGTGLHRFVDPADGRRYLYSYLWPYYANRLFPLFDQPNLKAKIALSVRAPRDWVVVSTGAASSEAAADGSTLWRFKTTPAMSSYAFSLHAGPYRVWEDEAAGIPLRLLARQSLAGFVAVDEWLDISKRGLDFYGRYFGIAYPFEKYDQLIVPDFNIGGMENIAAVTFAEDYVQREPSDRNQRERRASVILHEMAHMWFGDLVTHEWWNGLWLNESFATQMAAMAAAELTEFKDTWHGFLIDDKRSAYRRDSLATTHPIETPVGSTADFFTVFDAITYDKGSSVLKQLEHYVGAGNYRRGVAAYLREFAYGNTGLRDFIGHQQNSAAIDLGRWSDDWLYQPGFNTLGVSFACDGAALRSLSVTQTAPPEHPRLRQHRLEVALYRLGDDGKLLPARVVPMRIDGAQTSLQDTAGLPCPALVNPNHDDWAYAKIALDERSAALLARHLDGVPEPMARSIFLAALQDRAMAGAMPLADYVARAMRLARGEANIRVQQQIAASVVEAVELMQRLRPQTDAALAGLLPALERQALEFAAGAGSDDLRHNWFNAFAGVASTPAGLASVRALLDGTTRIPGLAMAADSRWLLLEILARNGAADIDALLAAESAADVSDYGAKQALRIAAARPDTAAKARWLEELRQPVELIGLARQRAVMAGLFPPNQTALQLTLLARVLDALPALSATADPYFTSSYASLLLAPMCVEQSAALMQQALERDGARLDSTAARFLREAIQTDRECLRLRARQ